MDRSVEAILQAATARAARWLACREHPHGKAKRSHPKRHSENKERSHCDAEKAKRAKRKIAAHDEARRQYHAIVRAYWAGERDDLRGA